MSRNEDTLSENLFFQRISAFALLRSFGTYCKGQMLTFQKPPLMSRDENHLVQGFFFQMGEIQETRGIARHLEIPIGGLRKRLQYRVYRLLSTAFVRLRIHERKRKRNLGNKNSEMVRILS